MMSSVSAWAMLGQADHKPLVQFMRSMAMSSHTVDGVLAIAEGCGLVVCALDKEGEFSEIRRLPSARCFSALSALTFYDWFSTIGPGAPEGVPITVQQALGVESDLRGEPLDCLCSVLLLFPDCLAPPKSFEAGGEKGSGASSLDTSVDSVTLPSPTAKQLRPTVAIHSNALDEVLVQRCSLAAELVCKLDEQIRLGQARLLALEHTTNRRPSSDGVSQVHGISGAHHLGEARLVAVKQKLAKIYFAKALILLCLAACSKHPRVADQYACVSRILADHCGYGRSLHESPFRQLGPWSLTAAEKAFDGILSRLTDVLDETPKQLATRCCQPRFENDVARLCSVAVSYGDKLDSTDWCFVTLSAAHTATSKTLPQIPSSMNDLLRLGPSSAMLLFDDCESPLYSAIVASTQRRVTPSQSAIVIESLHASTSAPRHILRSSLLERPDRLLLCAEKNKDVFVALHTAMHSLLCAIDDSSEVHRYLSQGLQSMEDVLASKLVVGEPYCHIVKSLYESGTISELALSHLISAGLRQVVAASTSTPDGLQRAQRGAMLMALLIQNICLTRRRVVLSPPVEAEVLTFCIDFGKVKACADLYATIQGFKKRV